MELQSLTHLDIKTKIYTIRNRQVMLDKDLAILYGVKNIRLREQVKRNIERFPDDFMFQLTNEEVEYMVSQNAIPSKKHLGGSLPYVFTEQGVASLSGVLTNKIAIEVNIKIMRAFVEMRKFLLQNASIFQRLETLERHQLVTDTNIDKIFQALENKKDIQKQGIFFNGQIFDAYNFVSDLIRSAKNNIVLIDNYIDDKTLTFFHKNQNVEVVIYTQRITKTLALDLEKYNQQYKKITVKINKQFHDRFLIIDDEEVYHIGASLKDLGKKVFGFSLMKDFNPKAMTLSVANKEK
ncbi:MULTISPECIES: ORF6N domain-containing protein [Pasteurellaceae]|uniref:ORF6N domain-containing protein n=1 Tax=Pasteurella atlantica TaxID=2827233 RepID=A0AAW8CKJ2_9PAST|nr:ORF6N domain-containing protein [Pasteurella atlantica]MBR0574635.1 ORF6N domain-containing protein [Pasteurella atlantica]MDP8040552.1 ORF6N domain-containing protein [Pasteurella atlantica]MDP8042401.1 ORF6N domain-containing protein [Pasteurella atlantica]MDP8044762.1 ORF6N domain-containing protein [Pasteurella atlantica]MDP8046867.1 ORF6N domain-containing protein [Pasteurella atlantica]